MINPSRARCRFCHNLARFALPAMLDASRRGQARACAECISLVRWSDWSGLAERWLRQRPEDWSDDVAAFLELTFSSKP